MNPFNDMDVDVDFIANADARISSIPPDYRWTVNCGYKRVRSITNSRGSCMFTILGGSTGELAHVGLSEVVIYAAGVLLRRVPVVFYDLDGVAGLGANDVSLWMGDFGTGEYIGRVDYDANGRIGANDLSLWLGAFGAGGSTLSPDSYCP